MSFWSVIMIVSADSASSNPWLVMGPKNPQRLSVNIILQSLLSLILSLVFKSCFLLLNQPEPEQTLKSSCKAFAAVPLSRLRSALSFVYQGCGGKVACSTSILFHHQKFIFFFIEPFCECNYNFTAVPSAALFAYFVFFSLPWSGCCMSHLTGLTVINTFFLNTVSHRGSHCFSQM